MLETIRQHAQGWLVKTILALIAITFALFGLDTYLQGDRRGGGEVARVGEVSISLNALNEEVRSQTDRMRQALGAAFDPSVSETRDFRQEALDALIDRLALVQEAQRVGLVVPDTQVAAAVAQMPAFQQEGGFSRERYEAVLRQNGRTPAQFENELRQAFLIEAMISPIGQAAFASKKSAEMLARKVLQQREIAWIDIPASAVESGVKVDQAAVEAFYEANQTRFTEPEQIRAEFVVLDAARLAAAIQIPESAVNDYYRTHGRELGTPETRSASHILVSVDRSAGDEAVRKARAKAEDILKTVRAAPERFAEIARAESDDPGSASQGGSLGSFGRGMMVKPFEDAVFGMKQGEIRGLVETEFGFHIIRLDEIQPPTIPPLDAVRAQIVETLRSREAQPRFAEAAETFGNLVYENADSLKAAAELAQAPIGETGWITRNSAPAPFDKGPLAEALFNPESIKSRQNTEAVEIAPGRMVAARVIDHRPARRKPLEEVSSAIAETLRSEQRAKLLAEAGKARLDALKTGKDAATVWPEARLVSREVPAGLDPAAIRALFRVRVQALPAYTGFMLADGSAYRLARITRVVEPDTPDPALLGSVQAGIVQAQQRADLQSLVDLARASQRVKVKEGAVEGR